MVFEIRACASYAQHMFHCNHTAVVSSRMISLSLTHTNISLLPAQRTAYILAKDILKNALFPTYIYIFFCVCKFVVCALFVSACSLEKPLLIHPSFAVDVAVCWETLVGGGVCHLLPVPNCSAHNVQNVGSFSACGFPIQWRCLGLPPGRYSEE